MNDSPVALEPTMTLPNGGVCARCQRVKKNGFQCGAPARVGFSVCPRHGAGFAARENAGLALPTGRPAVHGLYSKSGIKSIHDLISEVEASGNLKSTDREVATLKAALWFLLEQSGTRERASKDLDGLLEHMRGLRPSTPEDFQSARALISEARGLQVSLDSWLARIQDSAGFVLSAAKIQADIAVKTAQADAVDAFSEYVKLLRGILWDVVDDTAKLEVFEARIQSEIFAPMRAKIDFEALPAKVQEEN